MHVATFHLDTMLFGVPVDAVHEVMRSGDLEPVPRAPAGVIGMVNVRGRILAVTDARTRLGLPATTVNEPEMFVVQVHDGQDILRVDSAGDIVDIDEQSAAELPETISPLIAQHVQRAHRIDHQLLLVVDLNRLLDVPDHGGGEGR